MAKTIAALYDNISDAYKAVNDLVKTNDFSINDINVISQDADQRYSQYVKAMDMDEQPHVTTPTEAGAGAGATAGTVIGAMVGLLVGTSTIILPGVGAILALGPIGATLAGAGVGAAIGGLTGALVGYGIEHSDAELYTEAVRRGASLVLLRSEEANVDKAVDILDRYNPIDVEKRSEHWRTSGWDGFKKDADPYTHDKITSEYNSYPEDVRTRRDGYGVKNYPYTGDYEIDDMDLRQDFSRHMQSNPPKNLNRSAYTSAYNLGSNLGRQEKFGKMKWEDAQAEAHKMWAEEHDRKDEHWEEVKDRVQYAWHKTKSKYYEKTQ